MARMVVRSGLAPVLNVTVTGHSRASGSDVRVMPSPSWRGSSEGRLDFAELNDGSIGETRPEALLCAVSVPAAISDPFDGFGDGMICTWCGVENAKDWHWSDKLFASH